MTEFKRGDINVKSKDSLCAWNHDGSFREQLLANKPFKKPFGDNTENPELTLSLHGLYAEFSKIGHLQ